MAISEANGLGKDFLHIIGLSLVAARLTHPLGIKQDVLHHPLRMIGSGLTLLFVLVLSGVVIWQWSELDWPMG
jgi:uncharacterized membrane protein YecN with MAPEG domain